MEKPSKNKKKVSAKKPKKAADAAKTTQKPKAAAPRRKVSSAKTSNKTSKPKKDRVNAPTRAESQHRYFEVLGSLIAERAYELYVQGGYKHGHDIEDWLEAERQILPKEIAERS